MSVGTAAPRVFELELLVVALSEGRARKRQLRVRYMTSSYEPFCGSTDIGDCSFFVFLVRLAFDPVSGQQNYLDEPRSPLFLTKIAGNWSFREGNRIFVLARPLLTFYAGN